MPHIRSIIFLAACTVLSAPLFAQETRDDSVKLSKEFMDIAEEILVATRAEDQAREQMESAANLDPSNLKANYRAGELRILTIGKGLSVKYFLRVYTIDPFYRFDLEYWIGRGYQYGEEFDKALDFYGRYQARLKSKPNYQGKDRVPPAEVERRVFECQNAKDFFSKPGLFSIVNIGREVNSEFEDYAPVLNEAESELVFTSKRQEDNLNADVSDDNKYFEDIFYSKKTGTNWSRATNIGAKVNTPSHDSNLAMSSDGNTLFIYNDENGGDIYFCERENGEWGEPIPLPGIINSSYEENSITISSDEKTIYFSSNRPGGYGALDIYKATKDTKGEWSAVKNLGSKINTEFDDSSPFIDYDLKTLYFSTKGRKGMGGYDIFKSTFAEGSGGGEWSEPENIGYPINTPDDDAFYVRSKDGKRAYYASVREDGLGYTDIYMITEPKPDVAAKEPKKEPKKVEPKKDTVAITKVLAPKKVVAPIKEPIPVKEPEPIKKVEPAKPIIPSTFIVKVVDAASQNPLDAKVALKGLRDNVIVAAKANGAGEYEFSLTAKQTKDYRLSVEADGYSFQNINVKLEGASVTPKNSTRTIAMKKLQVGSVSILRNIYFDFEKASFTTEAYPELNKLLAMIEQNSSLTVEISGHTDSYGSNSINLRLSKRRAEAVKDYLVKKGVDARRITAVGYGETKPLASNDDEDEGRELNRRVEFKVLKN
jgi:outer membrane protein OmpA-like peptidoglycan-associated protein